MTDNFKMPSALHEVPNVTTGGTTMTDTNKPGLPCDFTIGHITFKAGTSVQAAERAAQNFYDEAMKQPDVTALVEALQKIKRITQTSGSYGRLLNACGSIADKALANHQKENGNG